ncbi:MAG: NAD(P)-dependent oxidoreductase [Anaerolineae bacterium]|nr:NAD(P)-dependent oxidoreductase [Anaerolineae bacterium]
MKVVVTGGSGLTGYAVVQDLVAHGVEVVSIDRSPLPEAIAPYKLVDCEDIGQVYGALAGADAVVHLAAIPRPTYHTPEQVFRTNVMAAFNVFEVAASLGIARVVNVSSMSVLGVPFFYTAFKPRYLPIDEEHPKTPEDAYAISKYVGEELADAFVRRCAGALSVVSLRFPWIHTPETFKAQLWPHWDDPAFGATNLWSYIDTRDVGQICRLALTTEITGHEPFFASAANSFMNQDIVPLAREFYPGAEIKPGFEGNRSLFDYAKAARVLSYAPAYSWEMYGLA